MPERFYRTFIVENRYLFFVEGLKNTLLLTFSSFMLGFLLAAVLCILKRSENKWISRTTDIVCNFFVQLPTMVMLMIFVYIIFGPSGLNILIIVIIALTIKAAASLVDIFYTAVNSVNPGEIDAAHTLGMSKKQTFFSVILPQAFSTALPLLKNQYIVTIQETSVVGYIAILDLTRASSIVTSRTLNALLGLTAITLIYLFIGYAGQKLLEILGRQKHIGD